MVGTSGSHESVAYSELFMFVCRCAVRGPICLLVSCTIVLSPVVFLLSLCYYKYVCIVQKRQSFKPTPTWWQRCWLHHNIDFSGHLL